MSKDHPRWYVQGGDNKRATKKGREGACEDSFLFLGFYDILIGLRISHSLGYNHVTFISCKHEMHVLYLYVMHV